MNLVMCRLQFDVQEEWSRRSFFDPIATTVARASTATSTIVDVMSQPLLSGLLRIRCGARL